MPRRIADYPDGYIGWNSFITMGTALTFISLLLFLYTVGVIAFSKKHLEVSPRAPKAPLVIPAFGVMAFNQS